ncbi:MAG: IS1 family transposase, partial [Acidobacteriaceae bacterium]|nr:IS1 family transposase [Acidobacteriaceae bacterium]
MDELCSFVYRKSDKVWVWLALCRETPQIVAFVEGDRSRASCERLWRAIPEFYKRATCYTDLWEAYREVIHEERHEAVGKEEGQTSHVERWINTLRQRPSLAWCVKRCPSQSFALHAPLLSQTLRLPLQLGAEGCHSRMKHYPTINLLKLSSYFLSLNFATTKSRPS